MVEDSTRNFNASRYIAELFESTDSLVDAVSPFLADGLESGDAVLVIMRLEQWSSVASNLATRNVRLYDAVASGELTVLDGTRTLARIMLHGAPCRGLFEEVIGKTVRRICGDGVRLRVYADMVDTLAAEGNFHGAHELEKLWSDLSRQAPVTVLCGYSIATFYSPEASDTFRSICRSHTSILPKRVLLLPPQTAPVDQANLKRD